MNEEIKKARELIRTMHKKYAKEMIDNFNKINQDYLDEFFKINEKIDQYLEALENVKKE